MMDTSNPPHETARLLEVTETAQSELLKALRAHDGETRPLRLVFQGYG